MKWSTSRLAPQCPQMKRRRVPRWRPYTTGIGHCRSSTSVEVEPVSIVIRSPARVTLAEGAPAMFSGHVSVIVPFHLGMALAGNLGRSSTRRRPGRGCPHVPIAPDIAVKFSSVLAERKEARTKDVRNRTSASRALVLGLVKFFQVYVLEPTTIISPLSRVTKAVG